MKKYLEKSGKTEDEALAAALRELGLDRDDVSVEIVERAKSGLSGHRLLPAVSAWSMRSRTKNLPRDPGP